jgi:hypothetical protein
MRVSKIYEWKGSEWDEGYSNVIASAAKQSMVRNA